MQRERQERQRDGVGDRDLEARPRRGRADGAQAEGDQAGDEGVEEAAVGDVGEEVDGEVGVPGFFLPAWCGWWCGCGHGECVGGLEFGWDG